MSKNVDVANYGEGEREMLTKEWTISLIELYLMVNLTNLYEIGWNWLRSPIIYTY